MVAGLGRGGAGGGGGWGGGGWGGLGGGAWGGGGVAGGDGGGFGGGGYDGGAGVGGGLDRDRLGGRLGEPSDGPGVYDNGLRTSRSLRGGLRGGGGRGRSGGIQDHGVDQGVEDAAGVGDDGRGQGPGAG